MNKCLLRQEDALFDDRGGIRSYTHTYNVYMMTTPLPQKYKLLRTDQVIFAHLFEFRIPHHVKFVKPNIHLVFFQLPLKRLPLLF